MATLINYYAELGLDRNMSCEELKVELSKLRRKWQTKANAGDTLEARQKAERMMQLIRDASAILQVESERKKYDKDLDKQPQTSGQRTTNENEKDTFLDTSNFSDAELLDRMEEAHDNGKYNTVIAIATQFIEAGKADLKVYRILAFSYAENGESAKSISTLNDMVTAMPDDLDAHFLYAFTMLRLFKNKESEARASIDFLLQNQNPVSPAVAALDVEYYIDCGDFALANAKTEEYRAIVGHDKSFSESIGRAYRQLAESYWEEYGGDIYIDNKENYENWKKYSELSLSVYPDVEYQKLFKSNMKVVGGITLFKENFSGILFSLILGLALTPGGGSSSFVGVLFILAFGFISVFSVVPKWMDHRYDYIGKLPGLYEVARHVAKVVGAIFNAIVWLVKTIIALILSFF